MESIPPRLPWAPLDAADNPENRATMPVAVIWVMHGVRQKKECNEQRQSRSTIEMSGCRQLTIPNFRPKVKLERNSEMWKRKRRYRFCRKCSQRRAYRRLSPRKRRKPMWCYSCDLGAAFRRSVLILDEGSQLLPSGWYQRWKLTGVD